MPQPPQHHLRTLGLLLAALGALLFVLAMFTDVNPRLLVAVAATALVLTGVYLTLPSSVTAQARYRVQPRFQAASGLAGLVVAAGLDYAITGSVDWTLVIGVGIGVMLGSGFFRSGTARRPYRP